MMVNQIDHIIQSVAANSYAIVIGLLLTAVPAAIWIGKQIWSIFRFIYGLVKIGAKEKRRRYRMRLVLEARDNLDITQFRLFLIFNIAVSTLFFVGCLIYLIIISSVVWFLDPEAFLAFMRAESRGSRLVFVILVTALMTAYQIVKRLVEVGTVVAARRKLRTKLLRRPQPSSKKEANT